MGWAKTRESELEGQWDLRMATTAQQRIRAASPPPTLTTAVSCVPTRVRGSATSLVIDLSGESENLRHPFPHELLSLLKLIHLSSEWTCGGGFAGHKAWHRGGVIMTELNWVDRSLPESLATVRSLLPPCAIGSQGPEERG